MSTLAASFHQDMLDGYHTLAKLGYRPTYFLQMVQEHGGVEAARRLLLSDNVASGLQWLWDMQHLDLSVEAFVLKPEYHEPFTAEERQRARQHLNDMQYHAPWHDEAA